MKCGRRSAAGRRTKLPEGRLVASDSERGVLQCRALVAIALPFPSLPSSLETPSMPNNHGSVVAGYECEAGISGGYPLGMSDRLLGACAASSCQPCIVEELFQFNNVDF